MKYLKKSSVIICSVCLVFLTFSSIAQICTGACFSRQTNAALSAKTPCGEKQELKKGLTESYTYYDAQYDDVQNDRLAMDSMMKNYAGELTELSIDFLAMMMPLEDLKSLHTDLAKELAEAKNSLERSLKSAGKDKGAQINALKNYYAFIARRLQDEDTQEFLNTFNEFSNRSSELRERYFSEAKENPYGYQLMDNPNSKEFNPYSNEYQELLTVATNLKSDLDRLQLESDKKIRKRQILEAFYQGIDGKWQKLTDIISRKGQYAN